MGGVATASGPPLTSTTRSSSVSDSPERMVSSESYARRGKSDAIHTSPTAVVIPTINGAPPIVTPSAPSVN